MVIMVEDVVGSGDVEPMTIDKVRPVEVIVIKHFQDLVFLK
jgi:hypothetical protein